MGRKNFTLPLCVRVPNAPKGIVATGELRLYSLARRLSENEFITFAREHDLQGFFDSGTTGAPFYEELANDLFYGSFTRPGGSNDDIITILANVTMAIQRKGSVWRPGSSLGDRRYRRADRGRGNKAAGEARIVQEATAPIEASCLFVLHNGGLGVLTFGALKRSFIVIRFVGSMRDSHIVVPHLGQFGLSTESEYGAASLLSVMGTPRA